MGTTGDSAAEHLDHALELQRTAHHAVLELFGPAWDGRIDPAICEHLIDAEDACNTVTDRLLDAVALSAALE